MFAFRLLLSALVLILLLFGSESSSSSGSSSNYNYDLERGDLTRLYNQRVYEAEKVKRPLGPLPFTVGVLSHSGVRVRVEDDTWWLIHKGKDAGLSGGDTVVTKAEYMSPLWTVVQRKNFDGRKTIGDLVQAGGSVYTLHSQNCHEAADAIMAL